MKYFVLSIILGSFIFMGNSILLAQVKIQKKSQYSSVEISSLTKGIDEIRVKSSNHKELLNQKKFNDLEAANNYLTQLDKLSNDINDCLENMKDNYEKIESDKIPLNDINLFNNELQNLVTYLKKLLSDIRAWNPYIVNQPSEKIPKTTDQLFKTTGYWTNDISEEQGKYSAKPGYYLAGYRCFGSYCDNRQLYFVSYSSFDRSKDANISVSSSNSISEEPPSNIFIAPQGYLIIGLTCYGSHCDNLRFSYGKNRKTDLSVDRIRQFWTQWISEEKGRNEYVAPEGHFIIGYECKGNYCDDRRFLVAPLSSLPQTEETNGPCYSNYNEEIEQCSKKVDEYRKSLCQERARSELMFCIAAKAIKEIQDAQEQQIQHLGSF